MRLPLFPLDVVLFPGALLPLHIFEPRYRQLLADVLSADRRFGLVPPGEEGRPPTGVIGTVAEIRATQPLAEGRANIVVSGERRFMLRRYVDTDAPYHVGLIDPFEDDPEELADAERHVTELRRLADRCADALKTLTDATPPPWAADVSTLGFQIAGLIDLGREFKQRLLGMRSALHRTTVLLDVLPGIAVDLEDRARVRTRAERNGRGGAHSDIVTQP